MRKSISLVMMLYLLMMGTFVNFHSVFAESTTKTENQENMVWLNQLRELTPQGMLPGCEFPIGTNINLVVEKWGRPSEATGNDGIAGAIAYADKGTSFIFDDQGIIVSITLPKPGNNLTLSEVKKVLGEPDKDIGGMAIYTQGKYSLLISYGRFLIGSGKVGGDVVRSVFLKPAS